VESTEIFGEDLAMPHDFIQDISVAYVLLSPDFDIEPILRPIEIML